MPRYFYEVTELPLSIVLKPGDEKYDPGFPQRRDATAEELKKVPQPGTAWKLFATHMDQKGQFIMFVWELRVDDQDPCEGRR